MRGRRTHGVNTQPVLTASTPLVIDCYAVTAAGILVLTADIVSTWPCVLAAILGVLLLLRARLFRRRSQVAAPLLAAAVALVAGAVAAAATWTTSAPILLGAVAPTALALAAVAGAFGVWGGHQQLNPKVARGFDLVETLLLLSLVPIILAVWDVYTTLLELRA